MTFTRLAFLAAFVGLAYGQDQCKEVTTVENFDLDAYISAPWYPHQQAVTSYTPVEQNFCLRAQYLLKDNDTFWGYTITVKNYAEDAEGNAFGGDLCAYRTSESKLAVAPCFLPKAFSGPYWVVAYDEDAGYALISGGQPTIPAEDGVSGCSTGTGTNNAGLWIFTRSPERDDDLIETVRNIASDAGFDLSVLNDVDHTGCTYGEDTEEEEEEEEEEEDDCNDREGDFPVWFGARRDCNWVDSFSLFRCTIYGDRCPETCGRC